MEKIPSNLNYSPERVEEIKGIITELYDTVQDDDVFELADLIGRRSKELRTKYPNYDKYAFYHALGGSGIREGLEPEIIAEDFPGEDSVELFINDLRERYEPALN